MQHDRLIWDCARCLVDMPDEDETRVRASLPFSLGGLGLRSATRTATSAFWTSWADSLPMIRARHPEVSELIVDRLSNDQVGHLQAANSCRCSLRRVGFEAPMWHLVIEETPEVVIDELGYAELGVPRMGWQSLASTHMEKVFFRQSVNWNLSDPQRAF